MINHLELFSGIGGFRVAMDLLRSDGVMDFHHVGFSEIDKNATKTYKANFDTSGELEIGDICAFTADDANYDKLPSIDLISGGFPCQSFSMMGSQMGFEDDRGQLFFRIVDVAKAKKPKYLLLENVKNLARHDGGNTLKVILATLREEGYNVYYDFFNSNDFGLPQKRNRIIIFATREKNDPHFDAALIEECYQDNRDKMSISNNETTLGILEKDVAPKYFLSEKIKPTILADGSANFKSNSEINLLVARPLTASMHKMHRACQDNYYSQDFIDSLGEDTSYKRMNKGELAKLSIRRLTPEEAMQLQGFPKGFASNGSNAGVSDGALYKQAGNAVSVNVIYSVLYYLITNNSIF